MLKEFRAWSPMRLRLLKPGPGQTPRLPGHAVLYSSPFRLFFSFFLCFLCCSVSRASPTFFTSLLLRSEDSVSVSFPSLLFRFLLLLLLGFSAELPMLFDSGTLAFLALASFLAARRVRRCSFVSGTICPLPFTTILRFFFSFLTDEPSSTATTTGSGVDSDRGV